MCTCIQLRTSTVRIQRHAQFMTCQRFVLWYLYHIKMISNFKAQSKLSTIHSITPLRIQRTFYYRTIQQSTSFPHMQHHQDAMFAWAVNSTWWSTQRANLHKVYGWVADTEFLVIIIYYNDGCVAHNSTTNFRELFEFHLFKIQKFLTSFAFWTDKNLKAHLNRFHTCKGKTMCKPSSHSLKFRRQDINEIVHRQRMTRKIPSLALLLHCCF